jgi:hypothetical protein
VKKYQDSVQYLVTSELLDYSTLLEDRVLNMLKKHRFGLCLCVHEGELNEELHLLCNSMESREIPLILWPLLSPSKGLYLNKYSVKAYNRYLDELFYWLRERGHQIYGVLVDCEPDYEGPQSNSFSPVLDNIWHDLKGLDKEAFNESIKGFAQIIKKIKNHHCKAIGAAMPFVCNDVLEKSQAWQDYWGGPIVNADWDLLVFMLFGSWFAQMGMNWPTAHYLIYDYTRVIKKFWRSRAVVALGVTTPGTGAETIIYRSPEDLAAAVSAVKAAGVQKIGVYDLKGIIESPDPGSWLVEIKNALPQKPDGGPQLKRQRVNYFKVTLYKGMVALIGRILEQIRDLKIYSKQFLNEFKKL